MHSSQRRSSRRFRGIAALAVAAAMLATTACSPSAGSGEADDEPTIRLAVLGAPASFDPAFLDQGTSAYIWSGIYDTLLWLDNDNALQPNAADSWEYSDDALTLTLTLRDGMTFSTGDPVDAAAVKTTLEYTKAAAGPAAATWRKWRRSMRPTRPPSSST